MKLEPASPPGPSRGSFGLGFVLGWFVAVATYAVVAGLFTLFERNSTFAQSLYLVPWIVLGAMIGGYVWRGKPRTALGLLVAAVSIIVIILLLAGAFLALLASGQGR